MPESALAVAPGNGSVAIVSCDERPLSAIPLNESDEASREGRQAQYVVEIHDLAQCDAHRPLIQLQLPGLESQNSIRERSALWRATLSFSLLRL